MTNLRQLGILCASSLLAIHTAWADEAFVVKRIQFQGLQEHRAATVLQYLPLKVGQTLQPADTSHLITALYQTGYFSNVSLSRQGNTLVVQVQERPAIASVKVSGNSIVSSDQINNALKQLGIVRGQILDQAVLTEMTKSLQSAYAMQGFYNARITTTITPASHQRVNVAIHISEGRVALVEHIHIIGNQVFSEKTLIGQLSLTTPKWNSFFTRADHYSSDALDKSLQALGEYYFDHGYLHFRVQSANAVLNPDRKSVTLVIVVQEGQQYRLSGFGFSGNTVLAPSYYMTLPAVQALQKDQVFSRGQMLEAMRAMANALKDRGYAFADVSLLPQIDEARHTVFVAFHINPGNRVYVRHIHFQGNTSTDNRVLRSAVSQPEGGLYQGGKVDESIRKLNLLGYLQNVKETTAPVSGSQNKVDLNYQVSEQPSAQATVGAGYGTDGAVFNAGVNESNFLGTGKQVAVNFVQSAYQRSYNFNYNNPYYTPEGVQRGFNIFNVRTNPGEVNVADYSFINYGGNIYYTVPFSEKDAYQFGMGIQRTELAQGNFPSRQIKQFVLHQGHAFNQLMLTGGWSRNSLDRALFPTDGTLQTFNVQVSAPLAGKALDYYKLTYQADGYHPLAYGFIGGASLALGYGGGYGNTPGLPFFNNYYAGGLAVTGQVRGYETNTLGPADSQGNPIGGNVLTAASLQLIMPHPLSTESIRSSVFVDAGNVYTTWNMYNTYSSSQTGVHLSQLRYAAGIDVKWRVPVLNGILELSLAKPLNNKPGDSEQIFSFNIGANI